VRGHNDGLGAARLTGQPRSVFLVFEGCSDKGGEQRMRFERPGFEFGVELAAEEPRVLGGFDDFDVVFVGGATGDAKAGGDEDLFVVAVNS